MNLFRLTDLIRKQISNYNTFMCYSFKNTEKVYEINISKNLNFSSNLELYCSGHPHKHTHNLIYI